jgi:hypothetical protein
MRGSSGPARRQGTQVTYRQSAAAGAEIPQAVFSTGNFAEKWVTPW